METFRSIFVVLCLIGGQSNHLNMSAGFREFDKKPLEKWIPLQKTFVKIN